MTFPTVLTNPAQANAPVVVNENFDALKASAIFAKKAATTSGLTWGYFGGTILVDGVLTAIADGTVALTASATNYVEATRAGVVSANTTGFTAGRAPLYTLVCGASTVTTETDSRAWVQPDYIAGRVSVAVTTADVTLSAAQARCGIINVTGALTGNRNLIVPDGPASWCVVNNTTGAYTLTVKTLAGTGIAVTQGKAAELLADGTNVILSNNDITAVGGVTSVAGFTGAVTRANLQGTGLGTDDVGFRNIPQNSQSAAYTLIAADAGKHLLHPSADTTARTFTIDSNANVAYPVGAAITFVNQSGAGVLTIAINTDTMRLAGPGTTGSRTLAANGVATALKIATTEWIISGTGLS